MLLFVSVSCSMSGTEGEKQMKDNNPIKTDKEWQEILTPEEYRILRKKGTERAGTGEYNKHKEKGIYKCAGCGQDLFSSDAKYDSGCGWPSFVEPIDEDVVTYETDTSFNMTRTEVRSRSHQGHEARTGMGAHQSEGSPSQKQGALGTL